MRVQNLGRKIAIMERASGMFRTIKNIFVKILRILFGNIENIIIFAKNWL